jgi:hypothetical protein
MACDLPGCVSLESGLRTAVAAVGWSFKAIPTKLEDPSTYTTALTEALRYNPTVVFLSSIGPEAGWRSVIPMYAAKHIPIVEMSVGDPKINSTVIGAVGGSDLTAKAGHTMGNWFIATSQGKGTVVSQGLQELAITRAFSDAFKSTVSSQCSTCTVVSVNNSVADQGAGKIVSAVVSAVTSHSAGYVMACDFATIQGLSSALNAAGRNKVVVAGDDPNAAIVTALASAPSGAWTAFDTTYFGWAAMDIALRYLQHLPYSTTDNGIPSQLLVAGRKYKSGPYGYELPFDFAAAFKALWKVS